MGIRPGRAAWCLAAGVALELHFLVRVFTFQFAGPMSKRPNPFLPPFLHLYNEANDLISFTGLLCYIAPTHKALNAWHRVSTQ